MLLSIDKYLSQNIGKSCSEPGDSTELQAEESPHLLPLAHCHKFEVWRVIN